MEIAFLLLFICFALFNKKQGKTLVNGFTIVFAPYVFIVVVNNYFCPDFYRIKPEIILIILLAMVVYEFVFCFYYSNKKKPTAQKDIHAKLSDSIDFKKIELFVTIIVLVRLLSVIFVYLRGGLSAISANNYSSLNLGIIGGRFVIFLYPLGWMLALKTFDPRIKLKKRFFDFCLCFLIVLVLFLSTVKAHAAIFAIGLFVVSCMVNKKNFVRGGALLVASVFLMFFGNYAIRWFAADSSIPSFDYTLRHFWKYVAGGTINMNGTALSGTTKYNFLDFWIHILSPIPNEFLSVIGLKITHSGSFPYLTPMASVSSKFDELSNVINLFGFFYGEGGWNVLGFVVNTAVFAFTTELASFNSKNPKTIVGFVVSVCVLTYAFLSFFSLYYATSGFWQILFYSAVVPLFFCSNKITFLGRRKGNYYGCAYD